jgi:phosphohistidine phosphatase
MDLILWRHAEAEPAREGEDDAARRLTARGQKQSRKMGEWLDGHLPDNCRILSSPAVRCVQTVEPLGRKFKTDAALASDSTAEAMIAASGWPDRREPVLLVGHQPLLGQVMSVLIAGVKQDWTIRKGNIVWIAQKADEEAEGAMLTTLRVVLGPELVGKLRG